MIFCENRYPLFGIMLEQAAEKPSIVMPEAAKRLSGMTENGFSAAC
jgi:hypothetical protein